MDDMFYTFEINMATKPEVPSLRYYYSFYRRRSKAETWLPSYNRTYTRRRPTACDTIV